MLYSLYKFIFLNNVNFHSFFLSFFVQLLVNFLAAVVYGIIMYKFNVSVMKYRCVLAHTSLNQCCISLIFSNHDKHSQSSLSLHSQYIKTYKLVVWDRESWCS